MKLLSYPIFCAIFVFLIGTAHHVIAAPAYERYSKYDEYDTDTRLGLFFLGGSALYVKGSGFKDVEFTDQEAPMSPDNRAYANLSKANYDAVLGGVSLGFVTMKANGWGIGGELEYIGFNQPIVTQIAGFINYGMIGGDSYIIGPYAKLGHSSLKGTIGKARTTTPVRLSQIERLRTQNAVDIQDGSEFTVEAESIYAQFGLHFLFRIKSNFSLFLQVGFQNEINVSKELSIEVEGTREDALTGRDVESSFEIEPDDRSIVVPGTDTPARLEPEIELGPWYASLGVAYTFEFSR